MLVPIPPKSALVVFIFAVSAQLVPFQTSVFPVWLGVYPPVANAAVFETPIALDSELLAVFKSFTSVQLVLFHDSVKSLLVKLGGFAPP